MPGWRQASALKVVFSEAEPKPTCPPPVPNTKSPPPSRPSADSNDFPPSRRLDFFDKAARSVAQKTKDVMAQVQSKVESYQRETRDRQGSSTLNRMLPVVAATAGAGCGLVAILFIGVVLLSVVAQPRRGQTSSAGGTGREPHADPVGEQPRREPISSAVTRGSSGHEVGRQASFEEHPPCVVESLSKGQSVWLLTDCAVIRTHESPSVSKDRDALYVVFAGKELASVVMKGYMHPGKWEKTVMGTEAGGTEWRKYPPGQTKVTDDDGMIFNWQLRRDVGNSLDTDPDEKLDLLLTINLDTDPTQKRDGRHLIDERRHITTSSIW